jgi:DNA invertase Pin-like site-specific DNA recombinase
MPPHLESLRIAKVCEHHVNRKAIVYVRQSSPQQVAEHKESAARQYALADVAVALGWSRDRVEIIDEDQGRSGRSAEGRLGFQRLMTELGLDHVGIILGLDASRLARSGLGAVGSALRRVSHAAGRLRWHLRPGGL